MSKAINTLVLYNVIPNLDSFKSSEVAIETISSTKVYNGNNIVSSDVWVTNIYRLIKRRYRYYEIAYTQIEPFLDNLWEKIEVHVPNFYQKTYYYNSLLTLSDKDLLKLNMSISNFVDHTDSRVNDPLEVPIDTITSQNASASYGDKLLRIRQQIYNANQVIIEDFLKHFSTLFLRISNYVEIIN